MPRNSSLLYISLALTTLLAIFHFAANAFYLYWTYWWFDWMMHFLAGLAGGSAAFWVLFGSGLWRRRSDKVLLPVLSVVICLLIVGVAWEIFEYVFNIMDAHEANYIDDVINDLFADTVGALVAALVGVRQTFLSRSSNSL